MSHVPKLAALVAALTAVVALALPAAASATVAPPVVQNNTLTVTSDADGDAIAIAAAGGFITVNGAATTLAANGNAEIVVDGGGGADIVDASALVGASYGSITINGGDGADLLTGGNNNDILRGDGGNDRLVGFRGMDQVFGGEGDDVMVWNNGDNTDTNDGEGGSDEVEVNGSPTAGDQFRFEPGALAGRVLLERENLVKFAIDLSAERLSVNGLGGDDSVMPSANPAGIVGLTALTLNGGAGADALTGGNGGDQINGGSEEDKLFGGAGGDLINGGGESDVIHGDAGEDRLVGERGTDLLTGGDGDDVVVWNNGDGTDSEEGNAGFDRAEVNGAPTAGDVFTLAPAGTGAKFVRSNLVPFTLNLTNTEPGSAPEPNGGFEALSVNGGGGDDAFTVSPGLPALQVAAGGDAGNDLLTGAEEADSFFGGSGNDVLTPGAGSDLADGQEGDDQLSTRDTVGDLVRGGPGNDRAQTDAVTVDAVDGVENLDATAPPAIVPPPAADRIALLPRLGKVGVTRSGGKLVARLPLSCPAAESGGCRTTLTLETAKAVRLGAVHGVLVLGSKSVSLGAGRQATVAVRLAAGSAGLVKRGKLAARVRIASSDAAGNSAARSLAVALRISKR